MWDSGDHCRAMIISIQRRGKGGNRFLEECQGVFIECHSGAAQNVILETQRAPQGAHNVLFFFPCLLPHIQHCNVIS